MKNNNSKKAYKTLRDLTETKQSRTSTIQNKSGKCLTEQQDIINRWTEYCSDLYNYLISKDPAMLMNDSNVGDEEYLPPILRDKKGSQRE